MTSGQVSYRPRGHGLTFNLASVRGLIIAVTTVFSAHSDFSGSWRADLV
jgi:hypothetical protein